MKRFMWPAFACLLFLAGVDTYAQTENCSQLFERVYADDQTHSPGILLSSVTNPENAIDADVSSHSTLNVNLGVIGIVEAWQNLRFVNTFKPTPTTPITVKLGFGSSVLGLLGGVFVQATLNGNPVGTEYSGNELLGLLGGTNQSEVTFIPNTNYDGVRIKITSTLGVALSAEVFHAYFLHPTAIPVACNEALDILQGVGTYGINAASVTGAVNDEKNSIDGDIETYSVMNIGIQALSYVQQTVIYSNPSKLGDSIKLVLSDSGGLLELELLTNFQIQAYLGNQPVGPLIDGSSDLLDIDLLGLLGNPGTKVVASYAPPGVQFDRIQIRLASAVGLLDGVRVHEIERVAPKPIIENLFDEMLSVCEGDPIRININSPEMCTTYHWFNSPEGGTEITAGISNNGTAFSPDGLTARSEPYLYYVSLSRDGCTDEMSDRTRIAIEVHNKPGPPDITLIHSH